MSKVNIASIADREIKKDKYDIGDVLLMDFDGKAALYILVELGYSKKEYAIVSIETGELWSKPLDSLDAIRKHIEYHGFEKVDISITVDRFY